MPVSAIDQLITALGKLPSVGGRSARRMALHLVKQKQLRIPPLHQALARALEEVKTCSICGALDDTDPCRICSDDRRNHKIICVVEDVADVWAIERAQSFHGVYHVLGGTLSALDGRGPESLRLDSLTERLSAQQVTEVILALSATVAGQTTAHYIAERLASYSMHITRLAHGIPMGGELDYLDDGTLNAALQSRLPF